ncbi:MAG: tetratricopeptide repeat protein, partial [Pseudomonadota bacterium]
MQSPRSAGTASRSTARSLRRALLAGASAAACLTSLALAEPASKQAEDALLQQAEYWVSQNRGDLAIVAMQRLLQADPENTRALFELGALYLANGDVASARLFHSRLAASKDGAALAERLDADIKNIELDDGLIAAARMAAAEGDAAKAAALYDSVFKGAEPTGDIAREYYQTIAGLPERWSDAHAGLERLVAQAPDDASAAYALAQVKTYQEKTRRDGVKMLLTLAGQSTYGEQALNDAGQALIWLDARKADGGLYADYLALRPNDKPVQTKWADVTSPKSKSGRALAREDAFTALNAGRTREAERAFSKLLAENEKDADALAGLGIVRSRQERFADAETLFAKATKLDKSVSRQYASAISAAGFWAGHDRVRAQIASGSARKARKTFSRLSPSTGDQRAAYAGLAGALAGAEGDWAKAEAHYLEALAVRPSDTGALAGLADVYMAAGRAQELSGLAPHLDDGALLSKRLEATAWLARNAGDAGAAEQAYRSI